MDTPVPPSINSMGGLLRHLCLMPVFCFRRKRRVRNGSTPCSVIESSHRSRPTWRPIVAQSLPPIAPSGNSLACSRPRASTISLRSAQPSPRIDAARGKSLFPRVRDCPNIRIPSYSSRFRPRFSPALFGSPGPHGMVTVVTSSTRGTHA